MGQYYMPTLIDAKGEVTSLYSHDYDNGLKLMEHSWIYHTDDGNIEVINTTEVENE